MSAAVDAGVRAESLAESVTRLQQENETLGVDLLRSYEQLHVISQTVRALAAAREPAAIERALVARLPRLLHAGCAYLDRDGSCERVIASGDPARGTASSQRVRAVLAEQIEQARQQGGAHVVELSARAASLLQHHSALLGALPRGEREPAVIILMRAAEQPHFDSGDLLAAESALAYGGESLGNAISMQNLRDAALETVCALANAIDAKDNYTSGHSERVGWLARRIGIELGLERAALDDLEWSGLLHDVGKIAIPETILNKPGPLSAEEFAEIRRHPRVGYDVLKPVATLRGVLPAVLHHHENHDGSGYPDRLSGEQIPLAARILHVADIFDALTSTRPYRPGYSLAAALRLIDGERGRITDPVVTGAFLRAMERETAREKSDFWTRFEHVPRA